MPYDSTALQTKLDSLYASTGSLGYVLLLNASTVSNLIYTIDASTNIITTASAHGLVTGTRVRLSAVTLQPGLASGGMVSGATDYYLCVTATDKGTLHTSLADAQAGTNPLDFVDSGSGTLRLSEQDLSVNDAVAVLVNHELSHADYTRHELTGLGAATYSSTAGKAQKPLFNWVQTVGSGNPDFKWRYLLVLLGGASTIGNTTGTKDAFYDWGTEQDIAPGGAQLIGVRFGARNP